jgi:alpha-1,6-mannosyltransferase
VSFLRPSDQLDDRLADRSAEPLAAARRWRHVGLAGAVITAVAALGAGALPTTDELGTWPRLFAPYPRAWPAVILAYLGLTLVAGAWWRLGTVMRTLPNRLSFILRTAVLWSLPLAIAPPLYSRDVYSYLAQGALYSSGMDPYRVGPAALGGALASNVSAIWQNTPAPYGPLFLAVASAVTSVAGQSIVLAVVLMRLVMIASVALTAACLIPLARRFGVDPATAVWLGVLNPLVLAHVVSGAHNDALMILFMVAGVLLAVRDRPVAAAVVLGLAVLVKMPAAAAIIVVVPAMARQLQGRFRMVRGGLIVAAAALATMLSVTVLMGTWYGWVSALSDTARVRNGLSVSTDLGIVINASAWVFGANSGAVDAVAVVRGLGVIIALALTGLVLVRSRGKPLYALALIMFAIVLLGPVVHPWYMLWGIVPLAVSTREPKMVNRVALLIVALVLYPMPWGEGFSDALIWGLAGIGAGLAVLRALRPLEGESQARRTVNAVSAVDAVDAARVAALQLQAR